MHTKANKNILLTIGVVVVVGICVGSNFEKFYNERIADEHLSEVNACIKRHIDEVNPKKDCTDGFLFLYKNTRHKIDYNALAERMKYEYIGYSGVDNKILINEMLIVYPSLRKNIVGLNK